MSSKKILSRRLALLQKKLKQKKIQAFFISDPFNVRYLTNFTGSNGQLFITQKNATFITDFRYLSVAKKILPPGIKLVNMAEGLIKTLTTFLKKTHLKSLHFEEKNLSYLVFKTFKKNLSKIRLKPCENLVESLRMTKSEEEIKLIIKAQRIAEKVFREVKKNLKPGKSEQEIAWEIEKLAHEFGADGISFPSIVGFNENSAIPHHQCSNKKLKKGDVILIDMGMKFQGYCSDMTRMIFTKKPTPEERKVYTIVLEAQEKSTKKLKANVNGDTIDTCARKIITKAGYGKTFGHSLGHGIGLEVHELPNLSKNYKKIIPNNTIVTVEPGIYIENSFGVRIEDMVLISGNKVINLTKIPKKIENTLQIL